MVGKMIRNPLPPIIGLSVAAAISYGVTLWRTPVPIDHFQRTAWPVDVMGGEDVTIAWDVHRTKECSTWVTRQLIAADGQEVGRFVPFYEPPKAIGRQALSFTFTMPTGAAVGPMTYRAKSEFICNVVQEWLGGSVFVLPDLTFNYMAPSKEVMTP
jgi:hypothetical protein